MLDEAVNLLQSIHQWCAWAGEQILAVRRGIKAMVPRLDETLKSLCTAIVESQWDKVSI